MGEGPCQSDKAARMELAGVPARPGGRGWARWPAGVGGAGVGVCPPGPSCMEAPGTHPWRPVARESWHQLVECAWGCDSAFGFEALFLLCFVYSKLAFEICFHASHPREGNLFGDNAQQFSQPLIQFLLSWGLSVPGHLWPPKCGCHRWVCWTAGHPPAQPRCPRQQAAQEVGGPPSTRVSLTLAKGGATLWGCS